jgi:hypothetical protein
MQSKRPTTLLRALTNAIGALTCSIASLSMAFLPFA